MYLNTWKSVQWIIKFLLALFYVNKFMRKGNSFHSDDRKLILEGNNLPPKRRIYRAESQLQNGSHLISVGNNNTMLVKNLFQVSSVPQYNY